MGMERHDKEVNMKSLIIHFLLFFSMFGCAEKGGQEKGPGRIHYLLNSPIPSDKNEATNECRTLYFERIEVQNMERYCTAISVSRIQASDCKAKASGILAAIELRYLNLNCSHLLLDSIPKEDVNREHGI